MTNLFIVREQVRRSQPMWTFFDHLNQLFDNLFHRNLSGENREVYIMRIMSLSMNKINFTKQDSLDSPDIHLAYMVKRNSTSIQSRLIFIWNWKPFADTPNHSSVCQQVVVYRDCDMKRTLLNNTLRLYYDNPVDKIATSKLV